MPVLVGRPDYRPAAALEQARRPGAAANASRRGATERWTGC